MLYSPKAMYVRCMYFFSKVCARLLICDRQVFRYAYFIFLDSNPEELALIPKKPYFSVDFERFLDIFHKKRF